MPVLRPAVPRPVLLAAAALATAALAAGCSSGSGTAPAANSSATITAVGAENEYANVISQVGGKYVHVSAVESNPNTDPHTFEASASVANLISSAGLVVQNGLGYDTYMNKIEAAAPNSEVEAMLNTAWLHKPMFTLRGGTNEVLRGVIARGMGLR